MAMHDGHRQRMRERFRKEGLDGFAPHEALELLLHFAKARGDVNPLAHELLDSFGSLKGVLEASTEQLMAVKGIGPETATMVSMIVPLFRKYQESVCAESVTIRNRATAEKYCTALMAGLRYERLYLISLSTAAKVVGRRMVGDGSIDEVPAYPRKVVEAALNHNAYGVILCHNHPGGIAEPSHEDVSVTLTIEAVLRHLGIQLVDHIIVAGTSAYSMRSNGLLQRCEGAARKDDSCREDDRDYVWLS